MCVNKILSWIKETLTFYRLRGCVVILGGILVHLSLGTLYTFGNLSPYLVSYIRERSHPPDLALTTSTWIYAAALVGQAGSMFLGGWLYGKIGPRWTTLLGGWLMSAGVLLSYFAIKVSFWLLCLTYGLMFGSGVGIAYIGPLSCAMKWMPRWKGVANGFVVAGFGFGALIFDEVQTSFINPSNARPSDDSDGNYFTTSSLLDRVPTIFLILGGTYAVMQFVGSMLLTDPPKDHLTHISVADGAVCEIEDIDDGLIWERCTMCSMCSRSTRSVSREDSDPGVQREATPSTISDSDVTASSPVPSTQLIPPKEQKEEEEEGKRSWSPLPTTTVVFTSLHPRQMLKKTNFYLLWFMFMFNGIAVVFIATLYKVFALTFITNDHFLAAVGSTAAIFNCLGRIIWGLLADRVSYKFALVILTSTMTIFQLTLYATAFVGEYMFFIWVCVIFFCLGGNFSLFPTAIGRSYGPKHVGVNFGLLFTSQIVSAILVSAASTTLIEHIQWYGLMFFISACSFVGLVLALCYRSKRYISLNLHGN